MGYNSHLNDEDVAFVNLKFELINHELQDYLKRRNVSLSTEQLFSFMMALPISMAIALDETLDPTEQGILDYYSKSLHKILKTQFSDETYAVLKAVKSQVSNISDDNLVEIIKNEAMLLVAHRNEVNFNAAIKYFLELEPFFKKYNPHVKPLRDSIVESMFLIVKSNLGSDAIEEKRLKELFSVWNLQFSDEKLQQIADSVRAEED